MMTVLSETCGSRSLSLSRVFLTIKKTSLTAAWWIENLPMRCTAVNTQLFVTHEPSIVILSLCHSEKNLPILLGFFSSPLRSRALSFSSSSQSGHRAAPAHSLAACLPRHPHASPSCCSSQKPMCLPKSSTLSSIIKPSEEEPQWSRILGKGEPHFIVYSPPQASSRSPPSAPAPLLCVAPRPTISPLGRCKWFRHEGPKCSPDCAATQIPSLLAYVVNWLRCFKSHFVRVCFSDEKRQVVF
jgi:hypothetical protein